MGDRCFLEMTVRRSDTERVLDLLGIYGEPAPDDADKEGHGHIEVGEANYGLPDERERIAKLGIPFVGSHESGSSYGPVCFAAADGEMIEVAALEGEPVCRVRNGPSGAEPDPDVMKTIRRYFLLERRARAALDS